MDIDWELEECDVVGQYFIMQSQKKKPECLTQHVNFISGEMLIYKIISTDEEAGTSYSMLFNVTEKLKSSQKTKSTEGATSSQKSAI